MFEEKFFKISDPIIGVDIGYDSLKVVQIRHAPNPPHRLLAINHVAIPSRSTQHLAESKIKLTQALKKGLQEAHPHPITTKYAVSGLPESKVFSTIIQCPAMSTRELEQAIPIQAAKQIPLPIENLAIDFLPLSEVGNGRIDVLVTAAPKTLVARYMEIFSGAGLELFALETKPIANSRSLVTPSEREPTLIIDIGAEGTGLTLIDEGVIRFTTSIPQGGNISTRTIAQNLQINEEQAEDLKCRFGFLENQQTNIKNVMLGCMQEIFNEARGIVKYFQERSGKTKKITKIKLCGGASQTPGIVEAVQENLGIPTEIGNLLTNLDKRSAKIFGNEAILRYTTAIGLAQREGYF